MMPIPSNTHLLNNNPSLCHTYHTLSCQTPPEETVATTTVLAGDTEPHHDTITTTTTTVDGAETITTKVITSVIENSSDEISSSRTSDTPDPIVIQNESTIIGENGEIVKEITVTETHQVTSLKPVEIVVEEAEKRYEETVVEEGELDIVWLAGEIRANVGIAALELNDNEFTSADILLISEALHTNSTLEKLDLQGNEIKDDGLLAIATALGINEHLRELYIGQQQLIASPEVEEALAAAIIKNQHILVFTYTFQNVSLRTQVDEALSRNAAAYAIYKSRKNVKTIYVEETTEVTTVKKEREVVKTAEEAHTEALKLEAAAKAAAATTAASKTKENDSVEILDGCQKPTEETCEGVVVDAPAPTDATVEELPVDPIQEAVSPAARSVEVVQPVEEACVQPTVLEVETLAETARTETVCTEAVRDSC
ncbi:hypothetical protein BDR26DRAFT_69619 [Obelidium mucronatum]|nr:hypothetical protein BDR26DRAFT_69619 [Obelidium mucronatum]